MPSAPRTFAGSSRGERGKVRGIALNGYHGPARGCATVSHEKMELRTLDIPNTGSRSSNVSKDSSGRVHAPRGGSFAALCRDPRQIARWRSGRRCYGGVNVVAVVVARMKVLAGVGYTRETSVVCGSIRQ
ncbi:hypothetical protein H310_13560 [Aphanomyces invadans]|uniref:Uncharacterized protein n=1 Tax=Aphanomyces invadans TaxID=157072 RepID=A0A024TCZ6_9STRA|nr:hypothetical protein H310_13560 [Aphanomyces invadans]ETV92035.1 hypothetical protein H310_13560 [Aphanomyces invadans]|eukprot:XP_008879332.1 hypothetical protein H310_13560 [Aphanomyces invadans]